MTRQGTASGALAATWAVAAAWMITACRPQLPEGFDEPAARAFQAASDEAMRQPVSPITAVDAFYFGAEKLGLAVEGDRVVASDHPAVVLSVVGDHVWCEAGCEGAATELEGSSRVPLDPFVLVVGIQAGSGGRVVAHDPRRIPAVEALSGRWFDVEDPFIVPARFEPSPDAQTVSLATTRGLTKPFERAGTLSFEVGGRSQSLVAFRSVGHPQGPLLVPFTDPTNGESTYHVGRYLEVEAARGAVAVDFNRATNPWCAYSPHYNCPVPPPENRLQVAISAGERDMSAH